MLTILVGLPGSGKSTYAGASGAAVVSSDELRRFLTGRYDDLSHDKLVFDLAEVMVDYYLKRGQDVVLDATNLKRERRARFLALARRHGQPARAVVVAATPQEAARRNRQRKKAVPEAVIHRLAHAYEEPAPEEGFDEILFVHPGEEA